MCISLMIILAKNGVIKWSEITKTKIINQTAKFMKVSPTTLFELWLGMEDGDTEVGGVVVVREVLERKNVPSVISTRQKCSNDIIVSLVSYIYSQHALGKCVTRKMLCSYVHKTYEIKLCLTLCVY